MRFVPLGVRGSTPTPGAEFVRYGGHSSCVAVFADGDDVPRVILDAGTGLRGLTPLLAGRPFDGDIVLTHLHWDHVQGLPFCPAIDNPAARVRLHVPVASAAVDLVALLSGSMSPPHFPITVEGLQGDWSFVPLLPGPFAPWGIAEPIVHKGGITCGVRVNLDGASLAYLPDHLLVGEPGEITEAAAELARGADVLLHDGQFTDAERDRARDYGHATIGAAMDFADACEVGSLVLTHHGPTRTDDELDALAARHLLTPGGRAVHFARQGQFTAVVAARVPR